MKSRLQKMLNSLKKELSDANLDDAFSQIESEIKKLPDSKVKAVSKDSFDIPKEIKGKDDTIAVFSDGACRGNPGPGAWGYLIQDNLGSILVEDSGLDTNTTNNQMEMMAACEGLVKIASDKKLKDKNVFVFTDSQYLVNGMNSWVQGWKKRGWKKADNKAPENLGLWQKLDSLKSELKYLEFKWVKGHAGHPQNEYCDQLANKELDNNGF